ncbi:MAG: hypothetical protein WA159_25010 [Variovorax sp.]
MAEFFRKSLTWVVDYRYDGRPRRIFKVVPVNKDVKAMVLAQLADLYGSRAELSAVRLATKDEELAYLRGDEPKNILCPTGRAPRSIE